MFCGDGLRVGGGVRRDVREDGKSGGDAEGGEKRQWSAELPQDEEAETLATAEKLGETMPFEMKRPATLDLVVWRVSNEAKLPMRGEVEGCAGKIAPGTMGPTATIVMRRRRGDTIREFLDGGGGDECAVGVPD